MDNCTIDCIEIIGNFTQEATCNFVKENCVQDTVQFIQAYYCLLNGSLMLLAIATVVVLLLVYYAISIATDDFLAPCLEEFIVKLNMSQALAGITFLALANGAPDMVTAIVAGTSSSSSTALIPFGSLFGAALFSMGFILSMVIYYTKGRKLNLNIRESVAPLLFYLLGTLYLVLVSAFYKKMNIVIAVVFFSFYLMYFAVVVYEERKKRNAKINQSSLLTESEKREGQEGQGKAADKAGEGEIAVKKAVEGEDEDEKKMSFGDEMEQLYVDSHNVEKGKDPKKTFLSHMTHYIRVVWLFLFSYSIPVILKDEVKTRKLVISLVVSPFVLWVTDGIEDVFTKKILDIPYAAWFTVPSLLLLAYMGYSRLRGGEPHFKTIFNIYGFVVIVVWITLVCSTLINILELLQLITNINSVFLGLTVLAWSGSIGDYLSIVAFAKRGYSSTAVSGIFSGQLLNFLIGFGVACIVNSINNGEHAFELFSFRSGTYELLSDMIVMMVIAMAFLYMVGMIIVILYKKGHLENGQRIATKVYYFGFVLVAFAISVSTDFFREMICDL